MSRPTPRHRPAALLLVLAALALAAAPSRAEWLQPDPSLKDALWSVRQAARDTLGASGDAARLDTLAVALLRVGRTAEASALFERVLALAPADPAATGGLGKLALFRGDLATAERLLAGPARGGDAEALADLFAAHVRGERWAEAAALAEAVGQAGREEPLRRLAERESYVIAAGPEQDEIPFSRAWPAPLVKVRLNGRLVLMAIDTGADELILDESAARASGVQQGASQYPVFWMGTRGTVRAAWVDRLELGGFRVEGIPAGVRSLRKWSLDVNPQGERVAGVIGLGLLRRFGPTLDLARSRLVLRRPGVALPADGVRVPFELWGERELTVWGSFGGGRRMAMVVQTGIPACGIAAPQGVFEEVGIKPSRMSRAVGGMGSFVGASRWVGVTLPNVTVGALSRDKVPGWMGGLDAAELWRHGVRRDAALSHDFFRDRSVTIDWSSQTLIVGEKR